MHYYLTKLRKQRSRGFSLIELMLALVIVSIVGSISSVIYSGYMSDARFATVVQDMRSISVILDDMYLDGALPDSLSEVGLEQSDPWGNPYQYLRIDGGDISGLGKLRKDKSLVPLNTDYDLYSMGEDGASRPPLTARASHDDIVRANNGGFVGLGIDY